MSRTEIDNDKIFSRLDKITGLPLIRKGRSWFGKCYISGVEHARWDKTVAKQGRDGGIILMEAGGDTLSLWEWMKLHGGCVNDKDVADVLTETSSMNFISPPPPPEKPSRFVSSLTKGEPLDQCNLFSFLLRHFSSDLVRLCYYKWNVSLNRTKTGKLATCFWYVDVDGRICHDKLISYLKNGKRDHSFGGGRFYVTADGYRNRCYFGEHLFGKIEDKPVYIVESEKTALLFWLLYRKPVMACGGLNNLRELKPNYILLPDIDGYDLWSSKGNAIKWWEAYPYFCGEKADIGDFIIKRLEYRKKELSLYQKPM